MGIVVVFRRTSLGFTSEVNSNLSLCSTKVFLLAYICMELRGYKFYISVELFVPLIS